MNEEAIYILDNNECHLVSYALVFLATQDSAFNDSLVERFLNEAQLLPSVMYARFTHSFQSLRNSYSRLHTGGVSTFTHTSSFSQQILNQESFR